MKAQIRLQRFFQRKLKTNIVFMLNLKLCFVLCEKKNISIDDAVMNLKL